MKPIPILMYHSITNASDKMSVTKENFLIQMKMMKKLGFQSINLKDLKKENLKKKFVITFDDGYKDVFVNAYPILKNLNLKATCFLVANQIGKFNDWDKNQNNYTRKKLMSEEELKEWHNNGFEIGSHTLDHKNLKLIDDKEKKNQIEESKNIFKNKYNIDIKSFSYPFGSYNDNVVKIVKNNFDFAVTTKRSRYNENIFNNMLIPRVPINSNTSILKFVLKILTPYEDIKFKL